MLSDYSKFAEISPDEWQDGTVVSIMGYGAFVRLSEGVDGMVHISQMGSQGERIESVYNAVQVRVHDLITPSFYSRGRYMRVRSTCEPLIRESIIFRTVRILSGFCVLPLS